MTNDVVKFHSFWKPIDLNPILCSHLSLEITPILRMKCQTPIYSVCNHTARRMMNDKNCIPYSLAILNVLSRLIAWWQNNYCSGELPLLQMT